MAYPKIVTMGGDGMYQTNFPKDVGEAAEGWHVTIAAPNTIALPEAQDWIGQYKQKYNRDPRAYAITAYDGVLVLAHAIQRIMQDGKPLTRENVQAYMLTTNLPTVQGTIQFDENGDIKDKIVSVFQVANGEFKFAGSAPQS